MEWSGPNGESLAAESDLAKKAFGTQNIAAKAVTIVVELSQVEILSAQQETSENSTAYQWQSFLQEVELNLESLGLQKVSTPYLVECPGMEVSLENFKTEFKVTDKGPKTFYLPTSPELHLKQLLCQGMTDIYEIKTCFRNEEATNTHSPEFCMLEWYRAHAGLELICEDLVHLVTSLSKQEGFRKPNAVEKVSVQELFKKHLNFNLQPQTSRQELLNLCKVQKISLGKNFQWDDIFFALFISKIEPQFCPDKLTIVHSYPPSQAALANISPQGWAQRFELYWQGLEIANAFDELTNFTEQKRRFEKDQQARKQKTGEHLPIDKNFLQALKRGMPASGGVAVGLERLFMALSGTKDLHQLKWFSTRDKLQ